MAKDDIKRPSVRGMKNMEYLGHFAQDKYLKMGHNDTGESLQLNQRDAERDDVKAGNLTDEEKTAATQEASYQDAKADSDAKAAAEKAPGALESAYKNAPMAH